MLLVSWVRNGCGWDGGGVVFVTGDGRGGVVLALGDGG